MRTEITFAVDESQCAAWLYEPDTTGPHPCVVMAHGFTLVREQRLDAYAERFAAAGLAVFLFDYRHFGASQGEPRQLLSIRRQLQDWEAAIAAARGLPAIDATRIALVGGSLSGGHVQTVAARDSTIAAVVAQVPWCDGLRNLPALGLGPILRLSLAGLRDVIGALLGQAPYYIPAAGPPGAVAAMTTPDAVTGLAKMTPPGSTWRNEVAARIALTIGLYRPGATAHRIRCPILYIAAEQDRIAPAQFVYDTARHAPHAELKRYPGGHFDVFVPPLWDEVVTAQVEFLERHLVRRSA
ncbi:alpha/beta hydrolase [Candidatus Chloroploca asiatica]|uniref:Alpha/beta hydrolase n=2 Tax=Candidatus Chloroploca asiatica TaxID=1506545 RepID=A0A2H3KG67_9CHLR|nr:alpha/beta hydrolase [Candidatus Chloroploca asiatica]PDV96725.1 alpha/beta hydrolase [Candidatus Chloroploca asiatica]